MADTHAADPQEPLSLFTPATRAWFAERFGTPTPPQARGWAAIQRGEHVLLLAPTGSGKTLAAFLWGIDQRYRELAGLDRAGELQLTPPDTPRAAPAILYISPLKALNNDISRNLQVPLEGIRETAGAMGLPFPEIRVAVRSGDTPAKERQAMVRRPPDILITTPESLYLMLTSPTARRMFRSVRTVILDEIHTLVGSKRGTHLSLTLERLVEVAGHPVQRIGLSATIQPLEEAARFLGGSEWQDGEEGAHLQPRPVTIVDAAYRKPLDLKVVSPAEQFRQLPGGSIWPSLTPRVLELIRRHHSTLIFCNTRRLAERIADRLNEESAAVEQRESASALIADGVAIGNGIFAAGDGTSPALFRAHHGSVSREARLQMEQELKAGELPALVATASLELGIDIGAVDLVVQLQAPESVSRGLQRVGRAGHLVGQTSKARIFPTFREEVVTAAAVAGAMLRGAVEPTVTPRNPLDVLAQQIVAMVSVENWSVDALYRLVRRAYPYQDLPQAAFRNVLEMLAGRYPFEAHRELRARLVWDRVNDQLAALPGSRLLALTNGGTIPDQGAYSAYLSDGKTKLGELDEEFVYETRVGDVFMLGSQVWRVTDITDDRVTVKEAPGVIPRMPFWNGEQPWRPYDLGVEIGMFRRQVAERVQALGLTLDDIRAVRSRAARERVAPVLDWLQADYALDENCAWQVVDYVAGQLHVAGALATDRSVVVERFKDAMGVPCLVVHSPFGGRVNGPWGLALAHALRERAGVDAQVQTGDDGILLHLSDAGGPVPADLVTRLTPTEARERILRELPESAVFGARFRQNAGRALLLPGARGGKRTPFWMQRLRARELLRVVRRFDDFPILIETYRECLQDVMDLPHLEGLLQGIQDGRVQVVTTELQAPSPVAQSLLERFTSIYLYEKDAPMAERRLQELAVNRARLQDVLKDVPLDELLKPEAVSEVTRRLQQTLPTARARTPEELALLLERLGDLSRDELEVRAVVDPGEWIRQLAAQGRAVPLSLPTTLGPATRWVHHEYAGEYARALGCTAPEGCALPDDADAAREKILLRFLQHSGPVTETAICQRYAFPPEWLAEALARLTTSGELVSGRFSSAAEEEQYLHQDNLEQIHQRTLSLLRGAVRPAPRAVYADFLTHWQRLIPERRLQGREGLIQIAQQLRAFPVVGRVWESDVFPARLAQYVPEPWESLCREGEMIWVASGSADPRRARVRLLFRGEGAAYLEPAPTDLSALSEAANSVYACLKSEGALFFDDLWSALSLENDALEGALVELVLAGLVTNDSVTALRQLLNRETVTAETRPARGLHSSLEEQLAARRAQGGLRRPDRGYYQAARRRVTERLRHPIVTRWEGRWSLVHRLGVLGKPLDDETRGALQARQLLQRWGVVTRASLEAEEGAWDWGLTSSQLRLMEMRGEVRRGYFVLGLPGLQYALPEAVEQLRARRDAGEDPDVAPVVFNACDPANLYGPEGEEAMLSFTRVPSTWVAQWRGAPVLLAEGDGATIRAAEGIPEAILQKGLAALLPALSRQGSRVVVRTWNGQPVLDGPGRSLLESLGFYRDYPGMARE